MDILQKLHSPLGHAMQTNLGVLDKLCNYCEALVQNSQIGEDLLDVADELKNTTYLLQTVVSRQIRSIVSRENIDDLLHKLSSALRALFPLLASIFQSSIDCESALFALVELKDVFNRHLGEKTVERLLEKLFPDGPDRLREFLSSRFEKRGFCDFCDRHEELFEGLAWPQTIISSPKPSN